MRIDRIAVGALDTNCYIVSDDEGGPAVVIDPGDDATAIRRSLDGRKIAAIVLTHGHFDHIGAVGALADDPGAPILVHEADADGITTAEGSGGALFGFDQHVAPAADRRLVHGDTVEAGSLTLEVIHTPGHTAGCICLLAKDAAHGPSHLFSGDTLFAGSVGRTDFPGGNSAALRDSIAERLAPLEPETVVHPGHGPDTTIGREARVNPFWPRG